MKQNTFSILLTLLMSMVANVSMAEIVNGVRQRPAATTETEWQMETTYYLYNVQARRFFLGGNDWNTRASIAPNGYKVKFHDPGDAAPEPGVIEIQDSVETKSAWLCTFATADGGAIWVDNNTETYRFWNIGMMESGTFRISNIHLASVVENIQGCCLGWNGSEKDTRLYFVDPSEDDAAVLWAFVSEANYQAYQETWNAMKDQFEKAAELLTYINQAKAMNIDVTTWVAIYENEAATVEELDAAIMAIQKAIADAKSQGASVNDPKDMTASILNPNFDNASYDGWKGTAPNMTGSGAQPANVAEHYNKTFDTYQDLNAMPKGVYKMEASTAFRTTWEDHANHTNYVANLYAKVDGDTLTSPMQNFWDAMNIDPMAGPTTWGVDAAEVSEVHDGVTYYIPNDPSAGRLYFEAGYYHNQLFFALDGNDPIRVGVMKQKNVTGSDWVLFDSFKLTFYGGAPEAYQFWVNQTPKIEIGEDARVSQQYLDAYNETFEQTATNKAEAIAAVKKIKAAEDSVVKNMSLWNELNKTFEDAQQFTVGRYAGLDAAQTLGNYRIGIENNVINATENTQSNAELQSMIDKIVEMINAVTVEYKSQIAPNTDVTEYLKSPGFEDGKGGATSAGWTIDSKGGGYVQLGGNADNHCFEAWHSTNFDVWQEVSDLPIGVYEIEVQGYVRYLDGQAAINAKGMEPENVPIYVYMNDSKTKFVNWFSYPKSEEFYSAVSGATYLTDGDGLCYPDNMTAASAAFLDGGYKQSAKGLISAEGDVLRVGVKGTPEAKFWPIFDNFKLTYLGMDVSVVKPILEDAIANAAQYQGMYSTKTAKTNFDVAYATAVAKLNSEDGNEMFKAATDLTGAIKAFEEGKDMLNDLMKDVEEMITIANESNSVIANKVLLFGNDVINKVETSLLMAEDVDSIKLKVKEYIQKLQGILELNSLNVANLNIKAGEYNIQNIDLSNEFANLVALQMDLTLPEGIGIDKTGCSLSSRITDVEQELKIGKLESGAYRITSTSLSLTPISGNDGTLLTLKLTAEDGCIGGQATISNIIFSTAESEKVVMSDKTFDISILYNLTYKVDGQVYKDTSVVYGTAITPLEEPTKEGYTFGGWSEIPETMPNHDVEITGNFTINKYLLTYMVDGEIVKSDSIEFNTAIAPLEEPAKEGYTFSGWSEIPETMPAHDVTITGTFTINKYLLTYMVDGEVFKSDSIVYNTVLTPEAEPFKEGYTFSGWSEIPETMPAHDVTITGTFTINKYLLTYMVDGEIVKSDSIEFNTAITPLEEPTKEGYTFTGWSEIPETMPSRDVEITGNFYLYGDVNTDEEVDVVDVVDIARFVVATPSANFREKLADLNFDNTVNIADAVTLVNFIAGDQNFARMMTPSRESYDYDQCELQLLSHGTDALSLCLDGTADFTAFQFEVELPENTDVTAMSINGQRKDNHQLLYNKVADNRYRVAVLSLSNAVFKGSEGELLNISINGQTTDEISVRDIHFVTKNGTDITFDDQSLSGTVTGITNVCNNEGNGVIFDLQGRKLSKTQRGVNIINGKKVIVNK